MLFFFKLYSNLRYIVMRVEITIPESLSEITLGQFQRFNEIQTTTQDANYLSLKMIEIFCNTTKEVAMSLKYADAMSIVEEIYDMFKENYGLISRFTMDGVEYGFIPNLSDMSWSEFIDIDTYLGEVETMHIAMNALFRPVTQKNRNRYNIQKYDNRDPEKMKNMPLDVAFGSQVFFYNLGVDLSQVILSSLQEEEEHLLIQYLNSQENGVGINHFMHSLRVTLESLKISSN